MNTHAIRSGESLRPSSQPLRNKVVESQHWATRGPVRCSTCQRHGNPSTTEEAQPHADHAQVGSPAASIAQWQSVCFVSIRSWVQSPVGALFIRHDRQIHHSQETNGPGLLTGGERVDGFMWCARVGVPHGRERARDSERRVAPTIASASPHGIAALGHPWSCVMFNMQATWQSFNNRRSSTTR